MESLGSLLRLRAAANTGAEPAAHVPLPPIVGKGAGMIAASIILSVFVSLWTCLRVWTRKIRALSSFFVEDILCYLGLVSESYNILIDITVLG